MVIVTPENFNAKNIVFEGDKNRLFYKIGDKKLPFEIANHGEISSPAIINGLVKELNFQDKTPTGNYRPGIQIVENMNKMTESETKLYNWYNDLFKHLKTAVADTGIEDEMIVNVKTLPFMRHSYKKEKQDGNKKKKPEYDHTSPPKLWGNCFYEKLEGESEDPDNPKNIKVKLIITDTNNAPINPNDLVDKKLKCFYTMQIYNYQGAPGGRFVFTLRLKSLKVKVLGDVEKRTSNNGQITEKLDSSENDNINDQL
jgi:hypothetical protein